MSGKIIAIIPARGGSKRIIKKNIRSFSGKPMIVWPIEELKKCSFIDDIIVSTDDKEISDVVKSLNIKVPFIRPKNISDDFTNTDIVTKHAADWYVKNIDKIEYVVTIYPTAVFLDKKDIIKGYETLISSNCDFVFSATKYKFPIQRAIYLDKKNNVNMFEPNQYNTRSQDLTESFHDAGQFCFAKYSAITNNNLVFTNKSKIVILPSHKAIDIDDMEDFIMAEKIFKLHKKT